MAQGHRDVARQVQPHDRPTARSRRKQRGGVLVRGLSQLERLRHGSTSRGEVQLGLRRRPLWFLWRHRLGQLHLAHPAANRNFKIGTLRVYTGRHELWSRSGDYGDVWHRNERVRVNAASFAFEYVMADGFSEPALSEIVLECDFAPPPLPPRAPPSYPKPLPPPNPNLPPAPPLPAAKQVPLDGLWIALVLACGFAWIVTHKKLIFGIGTPRTENAKLSFLQL